MSFAAVFPFSMRRLTPSFPIFLAGLFAALSAFAQPVSVNDGFSPDVDGTVFTVVSQPDGKLLVGGQFTSVSGVARSNLARLNADGSVDTAFNPSPNAPVRALLVQRDNRVVVGGDFTSLQPGASGAAVTRNRIARLNADGSVDAAFNPNPNGAIATLALQADGRLMIGGGFGAVGGVSRPGIARLSSPSSGAQALGVAANRGSVLLNRTGAIGEISSVTFEISSNLSSWTRLGDGVRAPGKEPACKRGADAAAAAVDEQRAAGRESAELEGRQEDGQEDLRDPGGLLVTDRSRYLDEAVGRDVAQVCVASRLAEHIGHTVADPEATHATPDGRHSARRLASETAGQRHRVKTGPVVDVDEVETDGGVAHRDFARGADDVGLSGANALHQAVGVDHRHGPSHSRT